MLTFICFIVYSRLLVDAAVVAVLHRNGRIVITTNLENAADLPEIEGKLKIISVHIFRSSFIIPLI